MPHLFTMRLAPSNFITSIRAEAPFYFIPMNQFTTFKRTLYRLTSLFAIAFILGSCSTPEKRHSSKINLIANTGTANKQSKTLADAIKQAETALQSGLKTPEQKTAYNRAIEDVVTLWLSGNHRKEIKTRLLAKNGSSEYQLVASWPKKLLFDELILARTIDHKNLRKDIYRKGVGVPYVAHWKGTPERLKKNPFMSKKGYFASVTATLNFEKSPSGKRIAHLTLHNANLTEKVKLNAHTYPLAYDQSALVEYLLKQKNDFSAIGSLIRPQKYLNQIALKTITPPDPSRIPVIFVHGLASEPRTWQNVYNELRADPVIREKYQIYFFRYPTGVPVLYSAAKLREQMEVLYKELNKNGHNRLSENMLLVGHSMGGLVSKSQVQDSGDQLWFHFKDTASNRIHLSEKQLADLQHYLKFKPNQHISRVIFIATPHRGSDLADLWIVRQMRKLIRAPFAIIGAPFAILDQSDKKDALDKLYQSGIPTSMDNLSPNSNYVKNSIKLPLRKGLKIHSIVGNLKGLPLSDPDCSDGVVPYTSAHLGKVDSELVVPYGHSAHEHPQAIEEIHRIMLLHLKELR